MPTITGAVQMVAEFHDKNALSAAQRMSDGLDTRLTSYGHKLLDCAVELEAWVADPDKRFLRAHLMIEELGECVLAMAKGDEVGAFDGLVDLLYVLLGTAATLDWPLDAGFVEVHSSNMTKERQPDDPLGERVRVKGPNYRAPDLRGLLTRYRAGFGLGSTAETKTLRTGVEKAAEQVDNGVRDAVECAMIAAAWSQSLRDRVIEALMPITSDYLKERQGS